MKNKIYKHLFLALVAMLPLTLLANVRFKALPMVLQERTISGRVSDTNQVGLPGVTVKVKGTKLGTVTDLNGHFTISDSEHCKLLHSER